MTQDMCGSEQAYASWLNIFGSDPVQSAEVAKELNTMRIVATSSGDIERMSQAYLDVLLTLAPAVGQEKAKELTQALVSASRAHRVRHVPGTPLMIEGLDCSPEAVRMLKADRDAYRTMVLEQAAACGSVTA